MEKLVTFVAPARQKAMFKVKVEGNDRPKWCFATKPVMGYIKSQGYSEGDVITIDVEIKGDEWHVSKVTKKGTTYNPSPTKEADKSVSSPAISDGFRAKSPEIVEENLTTAVSVTLNALQGHVNLDNVYTIIDKLYDSYVANAIKAIKKLGG